MFKNEREKCYETVFVFAAWSDFGLRDAGGTDLITPTPEPTATPIPTAIPTIEPDPPRPRQKNPAAVRFFG